MNIRGVLVIISVEIALLPAGCGREKPSMQSAAMPATFPATTQAVDEAALDAKLYGTWIANDVDVKLGQVRIKLVLRRQGRMKLAAWSDIPFVGRVRNKTAPYDIHDHVLHSDAIRGGTTVRFRFDGDQLVIAYKQGKTIRFHRK